MKRIIMTVTMLTATTLLAEIKPAPIFNDGMVLQRDKPIPVWGNAAPNEKVVVSFAGQTKSAVAGENGKWRVNLDAIVASSEPREMKIGTNVFHNVLVGEVWLCSGQSNMQFAMYGGAAVGQHSGWERNGYYDIMLTDEPELRGTYVSQAWSGEPTNSCKRLKWDICTPTENAATNPTRRFSAAAYHFGLTLRRKLKVPVGLILSYWGGVPIEPFIPREQFLANEKYRKLGEMDVSVSLTEAEARSKKANPAYKPRRHIRPRVLYNAMISPLVPYALRGAIWYQGEANRGKWNEYYDMLAMLRNGWADKFEIKDMPFFLAQITPYAYIPEEKDEGKCPIREEMERFGVENGPMVGTANISDVGMADCIHPFAKRTVGLRLAALALNRVYGMKNLKCDAPRFKAAKLSADGKTVTLTFNCVEGWWYCGTTPLKFELAGDDGKFVLAKVDNLTTKPIVTLLVPEGMKPTKVAYLRKESWQGLLKNEAGLPLGPFRGNIEAE